jgi:hypothetical protein
VNLLSRIASWLGENEATISAVVGIPVPAGVLRSARSRTSTAFPHSQPSSRNRCRSTAISRNSAILQSCDIPECRGTLPAWWTYR